ncbi:MAG: sulfur oxidation c-type cytochrome SoxX [Kangiella sp.]|nr:MAG: sulfur oxidation c-type cytochrome SoxX [Kangiella sp.]
MKNKFNLISAVISFIALATFSSISIAEDSATKETKQIEKTDIEKGQDLAFTRKKGNCLACHFVQGGTLTGNTGPALIAMKARFPEREVLYSQVFDARLKNANTIMPPFGAHGALSKAEIDLIVTWLYTL